MREILFRGKTDKGEWVQGYLLYDNEQNEDYIAESFEDRAAYIRKINPKTIGQYTGLTDKNGNKIFEGDIIKFGKYLYQITFECGSFALLDKQGLIIAKIGGINDHCYSLMNLHLECCWEDDWAYDIEIIGNIYDNPKLLERGDNNAKEKE